MPIDLLSDAKIIESWHKNATPWTAAVRAGQIESRKLSTDRAIVAAILDCAPRSVIDVGCGEGWLARVLAAQHISVTGIDAVPALIEQAQLAGGGDFRALSYEDIAMGKLPMSADVVVCNFSLLGCESVAGLFRAIPALLNSNGIFIVQTLHPLGSCGDQPYQDGWRVGSWEGFSSAFTDPAPWYFRTLASWTKLFLESGLQLREIREPLHPLSGKPVSALFMAAVTA